MRNVKIWMLLIGILPITTGYAQRHIKGQSALSFSVGVIDNSPKFSAPHASGSGYMGALDYVWYRKNERYWKTAFTYARKYYEAESVTKPLVEQYWLSVDYVPRGFYTTRRWLYIAPTAGLFFGYEAVNRNQLTIGEGVIQNHSTGAIEPQVGLEAEVYTSPTLAIIGGITERLNPFSEVSQFRTTGYIGIRYCFFR